MNGRLAAAAIAAALALPAAAQERPPFDMRLEGARDSLDRGLPDWREGFGQLSWRSPAGATWLGGYRATERFGQRDREAVLGAYVPLSRGGPTLHVEGSASSTHRVLARRTLLAEVAQPLGGGWVLGIGGKHARYNAGDVSTALATVERYLGEWRAAYTMYLARPDGGGWGPTHRAVVAWQRGPLTFASLSLARGREAENVFPAGILVTDVRNATLAAGFEVAANWGLYAEWARHEQGDLYTRRTLRIGTRVFF